jgi:hypothetical protein
MHGDSFNDKAQRRKEREENDGPLMNANKRKCFLLGGLPTIRAANSCRSGFSRELLAMMHMVVADTGL